VAAILLPKWGMGNPCKKKKLPCLSIDDETYADSVDVNGCKYRQQIADGCRGALCAPGANDRGGSSFSTHLVPRRLHQRVNLH
jgi:hypothetical protein